MTDPDTISADYTLRPSELSRDARVAGRGPPACHRLGPTRLRQEPDRAAGRRRRGPRVRRRPGAPARSGGSPRHPLARRRRPHPLGAAGLPAAVRRSRPLARQPRGAAVRRPHGAGRALPARAGPQVRRVRATGGRVAHRLRQPGGRPRRRAPDADAARVPLRPPRDSGRTRPTGAAGAPPNGIAPEVLFFIQLRPELLHRFDPQSRERAFPCPRTWEFASNIVQRRNGLDPAAERALFRGAVGEAAAVEFAAFLKVWRELPHPRAVLDDPRERRHPGERERADRLVRLALPARQRRHPRRHRRLRDTTPARGRGVPRRHVRAPLAGAAALAGLHPLGRCKNPLREKPMVWRIAHYPADDAPSRDYAVRAPRLDAAKPTLAAALNVPVWTLRQPHTTRCPTP